MQSCVLFDKHFHAKQLIYERFLLCAWLYVWVCSIHIDSVIVVIAVTTKTPYSYLILSLNLKMSWKQLYYWHHTVGLSFEFKMFWKTVVGQVLWPDLSLVCNTLGPKCHCHRRESLSLSLLGDNAALCDTNSYWPGNPKLQDQTGYPSQPPPTPLTSTPYLI